MDSALSLGDPGGRYPRIDECLVHGNWSCLALEVVFQGMLIR